MRGGKEILLELASTHALAAAGEGGMSGAQENPGLYVVCVLVSECNAFILIRFQQFYYI